MINPEPETHASSELLGLKGLSFRVCPGNLPTDIPNLGFHNLGFEVSMPEMIWKTSSRDAFSLQRIAAAKEEALLVDWNQGP